MNITMEVLPEKAGELREQGRSLIERAKAVSITDESSYHIAADELRRVVGLRKAITEAFAAPKKKASEAHRAICKLEDDLLTLPVEAERLIKREIVRFQTEEARKRREEEARIAQELRRREEDARLEEAQVLAETGHEDEAERLLERPIVAPVVEIARPQAEGIVTRRKWAFRVLDPARINREFPVVDERKVRATVTALGPDAVALIGPGLEVYEDSVIAVR